MSQRHLACDQSGLVQDEQCEGQYICDVCIHALNIQLGTTRIAPGTESDVEYFSAGCC